MENVVLPADDLEIIMGQYSIRGGCLKSVQNGQKEINFILSA